MKEWYITYKNLSIRRKIILIYLPLSLLPLIIFAFLSNNIYEGSIVDRTLKSSKDSSQLIISQTERVMSDAQDSATMLTININNVISKNNLTNNKDALTMFNSISNELSYALLIFPKVDSIAYIDTKGLLHTTHPSLAKKQSLINSSGILDALDQTVGGDYWFPMAYRGFLVRDDTQPVITLGKKVIDIQTGKTLGYLILNILESTLSESFMDQTTQYNVIDGNQQIIVSNQKDNLLIPYSSHNLYPYLDGLTEQLKVIDNKDGERTLVTVLPFERQDWYLISEDSLDYLTSDLKSINIIIMILLFIIIIVEILSSSLLSHIITTPIKRLTVYMQDVAKGNFDAHYVVDSKDEIGTLGNGFNHMSTEIKALLGRIKSEQKKKREYELALIQEQIKPHFLYNCLDAIYALTMMNRNKEAAKTTKALADYYRLSLSNGQDIISLKDEIKNVTNYLELQKIRYADVFDYEIHFDDQVAMEKILKLTLQPIVENAIYHGLKPSTTMGYIRIHVEALENHIHIQIEDNGVGMSQQQFEALLEPSNNKEHFGLYNVQHRIHLFFGDSYGLHIKSEQGIGTTVTLNLPYERMAKIYD